MAGKKTTGAPLAGTWRKASADSCANQYPEEIRFLEGGVYLTGIPDGEFRYWQSGDYEVENEHRLRIQTANDAMQSYEFEIDAGGLLTITDERRCEVRYERQHQGHDDSGYP